MWRRKHAIPAHASADSGNAGDRQADTARPTQFCELPSEVLDKILKYAMTEDAPIKPSRLQGLPALAIVSPELRDKVLSLLPGYWEANTVLLTLKDAADNDPFEAFRSWQRDYPEETDYDMKLSFECLAE